ncbi:efflux RND transporter periplasmic adaptor subunit [Methylobacterium thuringiense]|uniref:p-hydroxybenzoic acid efflux pump subunit AaeA n=1 Tax=Methylobacterium thuringiense TaxID=1003091 RepID=A0ABQ4TIF3_9HYPH|nr:efflux RND transporter periplasmic adaptor subunit [Methylobacterium thuringiense]GJE55165.1 p-hydroxybenzoic acid efflux pump subunit AaeA [Methylobacterium thuringiense]
MADEDDPKTSDGARQAPPDDPPAIEAEPPSPARRGRAAKLFRLAATGVILAAAAVAAFVVWEFYVTAPWTRDGRVRVQVANIAPQVSGSIVSVKVVDNQPVKKGDVLYVIDPFDFQVAIASAEAEIKNREADLQVKNAQSARRQALTTVSTSVEEKQQYAGTAKIAEAALDTAKAQLSQAKINFERTTVRSPVNGRVTNLLMRVGDYATTGTPNVRVIDTDSFWIDGYFEETKMAHIRVGAPTEMALMGYGASLRGTVESVTLGISTANAAPSTQGLPNVDPVYTWVRLAQRVPVRIRIDAVPPGVTLVAGMTATVVVGDGTSAAPAWFSDLRRKVAGDPAPSTEETPDRATGR